MNLGNPHELTILEFAEEIRVLLGSDIPHVFHPLPEDDPKKRRPDIRRLSECWDGSRRWDCMRG